MSFWFGFPGNLRKIIDPVNGAIATRVIDTTTFRGSAGARVEKALNGVRQYSLKYGVLGRENFNYINAFHQGHMGVGPFCLIDTGRKNLLTVNQSSATSATNDTRDFTISGPSAALSSDSSQVLTFPRTLKWLFSASAPSSAQLFFEKPSSYWAGIPVIPGESYTFWCLVLGGVGAIDFVLRLEYLDSAGNSLGTSSSATFTSSTSLWKKCSLTMPPPAGAVYLGRPAIIVTTSTVVSGESLYISSPMLQVGATVGPTWAPGSGIYPVQTIDLAEQYGFSEHDMLVGPALGLQEVM